MPDFRKLEIQNQNNRKLGNTIIFGFGHLIIFLKNIRKYIHKV